MTDLAGAEWDNEIVTVRVVLWNFPWIALNNDFVLAWFEASTCRSIDTHEVFKALIKGAYSVESFHIE